MEDSTIMLLIDNAAFLRSIGCKNILWYFDLYDKLKLDLEPLIYFFLHWQYSISRIRDYKDFCLIFGMESTNYNIKGDGYQVLKVFTTYLSTKGISDIKIKLCYKIAETIYHTV